MKGFATIPEVRVELEGRRLPDAEARRLTQVLVVQSPSLPTLCELTFGDPGDGLRHPAGIRPGADLRVAVGDRARTLFAGETTAVEFGYDGARGRSLRLRAYDRLQGLRKRCPQRVHVEVDLADLTRELTADLGISATGAGSSPLWSRLIQHAESDLTLLRRIAGRSGLYFWLDGSTLRFFSPEGDDGPEVTLRFGENLLEASVELNTDATAAEARVQGWDPWLAEARQGVASRARVGRRIRCPEPRASGGESVAIRTNLTFQAEEQADAAAQAELDQRSGRAVVLRGVAEGDVDLRPGAVVEVGGLSSELEGRYALTSVTHRIDDRGYRSEFSTLPPDVDQPGEISAPGLALGIVSQADDPDGLGRVKVELASCGGLESDWLQTVAPGGGQGRGLVAVPDVGDRVAVLFVNGDLAQGVVLGGLFGSDGPPDAGVESGRVKRLTLRSAAGQVIRFDDTGKSIRIENQQGSFVDLGPERLLVHAEGDLEIEAPGKTLILRAAAVDFQQG